MKFWYVASFEKDLEVKELFLSDYENYTRGLYSGWPNDRDGCLAAIILLDQFSRHLFRRSERAFAMDSQAVLLSQSLIAN